MTTKALTKKPVRCAIYTRKSTEEGLEQDFNSLDAQREAGESCVKAQLHEGWVCLPERYDDGGYTGGNMERPGLQKLLANIEAGKIDCVVVYKVDRLSRSLLDFARMMEAFEKNQVSFVSVTQHFNTATSLGRLILNILLSFAQFEREMISERTRDKIAATRRKGKWSGGQPLLGYDVTNTKLVVNEAEAFRIREIFELYLRLGTVLETVKELNRRGWRTKEWVTKKEKRLGGRPFTKTRVYHLLTNVVYIGKVRYKREVHAGEHAGIVDEGVFQKVQESLRRNGRCGGRLVRNKHGALLKGMLRCASCNCGMTPSFSTKGNRLYRYYVCNQAQQRGWDICPAPSVPAGEIEKFVVDELQPIASDPAVLKEIVRHLRQDAGDKTARLCRERDLLRQEIAKLATGLEQQAMAFADTPSSVELAVQMNERMRIAQCRLSEIDSQLSELADDEFEDGDVARLLSDFGGVWAALSTRDQCRLIDLLIDGVEYDGKNGAIAITFRQTGFEFLKLGAKRHRGDE